VLSSTHRDTKLGYFTEDVNCRLRKTGIEENFERLFYLQGANTINMSGFNPALLTNVPCLPAPSGVVSNFVDPEDRKLQPRLITYVTLPIMIVFVALRLHARATISRGLGADDCTSAYGFQMI
jgi:hypothetical protein